MNESINQPISLINHQVNVAYRLNTFCLINILHAPGFDSALLFYVIYSRLIYDASQTFPSRCYKMKKF